MPANPTPQVEVTVVDIYEIDRKKKREKGTNPLKFAELKIPFVKFIDERARAAKDAAEQRMNRKSASVSHDEQGHVVVLFNKAVL